MALFSPWGNQQFFDDNGNPATGWKIYAYAAGSNTPLATFTTSAGDVAQSQPIILNSLGFPTNGQIFLTSGLAYKLVLTNASDVVKKTADGITGVTGTSTASQWQASGLTPTYVSATSFTLSGDQTTNFHVNRRIQSTNTVGTITSTITATAYTTLTTVTVVNDSGALDSGLSAVNFGLLTANNPSVPTSYAKSGSNSDITSLAGLTSINGAAPPGNILKNGNKLVFPHGSSATIAAGVAVPTSSLGYYTTGMFYAYCTGANVTLASVAGADATHRYDQFTGAASVTGIGHGYRAESFDSAHIASRTCTYTVELANSLLTTVSWAASYANSTDAFGTIGTPTKTVFASGTFTVTSTVTKYSVQISAPAAATTGIEIVLTVGAQTSGTWTIGREDFRVGGALPGFFETPKIDETVRAVQRYYERVSGDSASSSISVAQYGLAGNAFNVPVFWKATKRANPTLSKAGTWTVTNTSQPTVGGAGRDSCFIQGIVTATGQAVYATADASTYIDASAYIP